MGKLVHNDVLDAALNYLKSNVDTMVACSTQPTNGTEALTTYALCDVVLGTSDFTIADGDSSGRKVTVGAKDDITIDTSGTYEHIALLDGTKLLFVTTGTSQYLTAGNKLDFPAWDIEASDPV